MGRWSGVRVREMATAKTPFRGVGSKGSGSSDEITGAAMTQRGGVPDELKPIVRKIRESLHVSKEAAIGKLVRIQQSMLAARHEKWQKPRDVPEFGLDVDDVAVILRHLGLDRLNELTAERERLSGELEALVGEMLEHATPNVVESLVRLAASRGKVIHETVGDVIAERVPTEQMVACLSPECRATADALKAEWGIDEREACYRAMYKDPCGHAYQGYILGTVENAEGRRKARIKKPDGGMPIEATTEVFEPGEDGLPVVEGLSREDALRRMLALESDEMVATRLNLTADRATQRELWGALPLERRNQVSARMMIDQLRCSGIMNATRADLAPWGKQLYEAGWPGEEIDAVFDLVEHHFANLAHAREQGYIPTETIAARLRDKLSPATQDMFLRELEAHATTFSDTMPGEPLISETALREILLRVERAEAELQEALAKRRAEQERRDLEAAFLKAAAEFRRLKPWTRRLFPFVLDLRLLEPEWPEVRVEVKAEPPELSVTLPGIDEPFPMFGLENPFEDISDFVSSLPPDDLTTTLALQVYLCAMLAVIDLLTREIRLVERKREVKKRIHPEKCVPPMTYNYRPVVYAPRTITIAKHDRQIDVAMERAREERERKEAERLAREAQKAQEEAQAQAEVEREIARLNAAPRPRVKHLVACHIRRVRMSVRHQLDLARMMANGWTPIDKEGHEIPFPRAGEYTIVRDCIKGTLEPEVVSRRVVTTLIGALADVK